MRDALRALRSTPIVTAVAILSLALGIGANTAIFSLLDAILLRSLPVRDPGRVVQLLAGPEGPSWTNPLWEQIRAHGDIFDGVCAWGSQQFNLARGGETDFANGILTSGRFFDVLGVPALVGRTFTVDDDRRGGGRAGPVALISYAFWQRHFGGAADVLGRTVWLDGAAFTVVGVTPASFTGPSVGTSYDVAIPINAKPLLSGGRATLDARGWFWLAILARLKPNQTVDSATAALRGVQPQIRAATLPGWAPDDLKDYLRAAFDVIPASSGPSFLRRRYEQPLLALMVIVGLVLLIACANIANVLLARATARRHEMSVRLALGATRGRLLRQLLLESTIVAAIGAAVGLLFAEWGSLLLVHQISIQDRQLYLDLSPDWRVLAFTSGIAILTAILFGTAPALRAAAVAPIDALKDHARGARGDRRGGVLHALVVAQVALSLVLLVGAGLFVRTFIALTHVPLGFNRDRLLVVSLDARRSGATPETRAALYERIRQSVAAVPGVAGTALSTVTPVSGNIWANPFENPRRPSTGVRPRDVYLNQISAGWFTTYGTALVAGRAFDDERDRIGGAPVVIVNEAFARQYFPSGGAAGQFVREAAGRPGQLTPELEIVGVVQDAIYASVRAPAPPTLYYPFSQAKELGPAIQLTVRAARGAPASLARSLDRAVARVDDSVSFSVHPLGRELDQSLAQERIAAMLSAFFGALALLLAGIGLYGVMSYTVSRRRTEIGICMALGATPATAVASILLRVAVLVGAGVAAGATLALWASRFVASLLFGLASRDPATIGGAAAVLVITAAAAAWLPARRAARIDPARVLREG